MVSLQAALVALALSGTGQTVLLDFYTDWCGPCKAMNPTVQALVAKGYPVQRVNAEQNRALADKYRVTSYPCFVMLVDGREVDRVLGGTTLSRLERMCKMGPAKSSPGDSPVMFASHTTPVAPSPLPPSAALSAPFEGWGNQPGPNQPGAVSSRTVSDAAMLAASVRLRIEDPDGRSCGSGTIIDSRGGEALILTCGHIFRDSKGKGRIEVDLFGPNGSQPVQGRLVSYDSEVRDVGLVAIRTPGPVATARVAPPGYRIVPGAPVVSIGCNNGDAPTVRHSQINSLDKFQGPPNIQVAGQPVEGRSGGGLFTSEGYVIGVCNAADPSDKEGLFAALGSICAELDRSELAFIYKSPSENPVAATAVASPMQAMPKSMPGAADLASLGSLPASTTAAASALPPHEQAALEEIHRRVKEGSEVTIVIHPRNGSDAKSEVFTLDHASSEFTRQLSAEGRRQEKQLSAQGHRQDKGVETSLELPQPRKILLEWSAEGAHR